MSEIWGDKPGVARAIASLPTGANGAELIATLAKWRFGRAPAPSIGLRDTLGRAFARGPAAALYAGTHLRTFLRLAARDAAVEPDGDVFHLAERFGWASPNPHDLDAVAHWGSVITHRHDFSDVEFLAAGDLLLWLDGHPLNPR